MHTQINQTYGSHARFDAAGNRGMTEDEMRKIAPSVFAVAAHESRSDRFVPIPTIEILRSLKTQGFEVVGAKQSVTRVPGKSDFTKHMLRLRKIDADASYSVGDTVAEVLLKNANDGTSVYDLFAGLFRIRCLNSMVALMNSVSSHKVRHSGKSVRDDVIDGTFTVIKDAQLALAAPREWSQIKLERAEAQAFAEAAHQIRFADGDGEVKTPVSPEQLLIPRRAGDTNPDLWSITNVVQEHIIRGGDTALGRDANNNLRRVTTRAVKGIDQDVRLNRALFTLANKMAELKGVKIAA